MSQEKAQLIAPEGTFTVPGLNVAGVVTGGNFVGNVTGSASSLAKGANLIVGVLTASSFVGDVTGNVTGITSNTDNLTLGEVTATSFVGDFTGIASGITGGPNITAGLVTATKFQGNTPGSSTGVSGGKNINVGTFTASSFAGDLTGNAAGLSTTTANLKLGITSATSFAGDLTGNASELAGSSANLKLGITSASSFAGDLFGNASNLAGSSARLKLGIVTASSFAGNLTGNVASLTGTSANLNLGIVTASSFAGNLTGNVASLSTNNANMRLGIVTASSFAGNLLGNAASVSGTPNLKLGICTASSFAGNLTGNAAGLSNNTSHANLGIVTATTFSGDASNLTGISAGPVNQQSVTANGANTAIDLGDGNLVYMTQSANTTISFTGISGNTAVVYLIRIKDDSTTTRTITWPSGIVWDGGSEPSLLQDEGGAATKGEVFKLTTRDNGTTWYGEELVNFDILTTNYELWTIGGNEVSGQLGLNQAPGDIAGLSSPVQIPGTTWARLSNGAGGWAGGALLRSSKQLFMWGTNDNSGNLGQNNRTVYSSPVQVSSSGWITSTVASATAVAAKTDGTLWAWGANSSGQLGVGDRTQYSSPIQIGSDTTWPSSADKLAVSSVRTMAIKTDGTLWMWGSNYKGELGQNNYDNPTNKSSPVQIPGTSWAKVSQSGQYGAIRTDGTLWTWGANNHGALGHNQGPGQIAGYSSPVQLGSDTTWRSYINSGSTAVATKTDGTLWGWGIAYRGSLGLNQGDNVRYSSPVQIGSATDWTDNVVTNGSYSGGVKTNGEVWVWGHNHKGALGQNNRTQYSSPVQIPGTDWVDIQAVGENGFNLLQST